MPVSRPNAPPATVLWPSERVPYWKRLIVLPGHSYVFVPMCDRLLTYYCHYHARTYIPCYRDEGDPCLYCKPEGPRRVFQGALVGIQPGDKQLWIANLTEGAMAGCPELKDHRELFGVELKIERREGPRNAPMSVAVMHRRHWARVPTKVIGQDELWKVQLNVWGVEPYQRDEKEANNAGVNDVQLVPLDELGH